MEKKLELIKKTEIEQGKVVEWYFVKYDNSCKVATKDLSVAKNVYSDYKDLLNSGGEEKIEVLESITFDIP